MLLYVNFYSNQGYIYLIKNTVKMGILWIYVNFHFYIIYFCDVKAELHCKNEYALIKKLWQEITSNIID